jgi:phenylalanyl-tRNA synthetase beta chain
LNLALLKALGIEGKVYGGIFAILPANLPATLTARRFADFSLFPAALRDLALVVPEAIPAAEVQRALRQTARAQVGSAFGVEAVTVFDVYRGAGLPPGTKSLAFSLVFRSPTRTLTDDEVNAVFQKVQDDLVKTTGWQIRK